MTHRHRCCFACIVALWASFSSQTVAQELSAGAGEQELSARAEEQELSARAEDRSQSPRIARDELRFVGQVLGTVEYGPRSHDRAKKWGQAPWLRIVDANESQRKLVIATAKHINEALPSEFRIRWKELPPAPASPQREPGVIRVHFCDSADFASLSKRYGFATAPEDNDGYVRVWWDNNMQLQSAVVFLAEDRLADRPIVREHTVLEELMQSLGPLGDSSYYPHSVFYENKEKDVFGTATRLSELDKHTLRFLYTHVPLGSHASEIGYLMAQHWRRSPNQSEPAEPDASEPAEPAEPANPDSRDTRNNGEP